MTNEEIQSLVNETLAGSDTNRCLTADGILKVNRAMLQILAEIAYRTVSAVDIDDIVQAATFIIHTRLNVTRGSRNEKRDRGQVD